MKFSRSVFRDCARKIEADVPTGRSWLMCVWIVLAFPLASFGQTRAGDVISLLNGDSQWGCFISDTGTNTVVKVSPDATSEAQDVSVFTVLSEFSSKKKANRWIEKGLERDKQALVKRGRKAKKCLAERSIFSNPNSDPEGGGPGGSGGNKTNSDDACTAIANGAFSSDRISHPSFRIINGTKCDIGDSAVVELGVVRSDGDGLCSGVVVGDHKILTAAHCVVSSNGSCTNVASQIYVYIGGSLFEVTNEFAIHPDYDCTSSVPGAGANDVVVVTTDGTITSQQMSVLSSSGDISSGDSLLIAGYGLVDRDNDGDADGNSGDGLHAGFMTVDSTSTSEIFSSFNFNSTNPGSNTCSGDSGGPAFVKVGDQYFVAGLTSYGVAALCGPTDSVVGFVNLTDPDVQSFLTDNGVE